MRVRRGRATVREVKLESGRYVDHVRMYRFIDAAAGAESPVRSLPS
jgi:hypothetical protein